MRVYLDNCCFNRPFDDQEQLTIRLETESKLYVQQMIIDKKVELLWSFILDYENNDNPFIERKERIEVWFNQAIQDISFSEEILTKGKQLMVLGLRAKDALHVSCAIAGNADCFLTTDKKLLNKGVKEIEIMNPIDFVRRYCNE